MVVRTHRALVLQRTPWSESSLVVHVATAGHGRVHLVARGEVLRAADSEFRVLDASDRRVLRVAVKKSETPKRALT